MYYRYNYIIFLIYGIITMIEFFVLEPSLLQTIKTNIKPLMPFYIPAVIVLILKIIGYIINKISGRESDIYKTGEMIITILLTVYYSLVQLLIFIMIYVVVQHSILF